MFFERFLKFFNTLFSYVSSKHGTVFEINYELIGVHKVRRLLPTGSRQDVVEVTSEFGIGINCLSVNEAFCVTGSDDGYLRLWPLDFSGVVLEAGKYKLNDLNVTDELYRGKRSQT